MGVVAFRRGHRGLQLGCKRIRLWDSDSIGRSRVGTKTKHDERCFFPAIAVADASSEARGLGLAVCAPSD